MFWMFFLSSLFQGPFESCQRLFFFFKSVLGGRTSNSCSVVRFLKITFFPLESRREYESALPTVFEGEGGKQRQRNYFL